MPEEKILTVDFTQQDACSEIMPRSPLLSSYHANWNSLRLDYFRQPGHETPEHCFQQHIIGICLSSTMTKIERVLDGHLQQEQVINGDVVIIPANVHHISRSLSPGEFILLSLEPAFFHRITLETIDLYQPDMLPHFAAPDPLIQQIGLALKSELESDGKGSLIYIESLAHTLCIHLLRHYCVYGEKVSPSHEEKGLSPLKLQKAISYIQENLEKDLSLTEISAFVGMSMYHFSRMFKKSTGFPPHQYVMNCRIERAKNLLIQGEKTIDQIYQLVGFQSQSHFTNVFRKIIGTTPKVFRDQVKN